MTLRATRRGLLVCVLVCFLAVQAVRAAPVEVQDDRGKMLRLAQPAARIVSLAPHLTEIAYAAGAGARLIAVSEYSDYPPEARRLPRVGDGARVDIERILTLKPELVLAWKSGNQAGDIARLEKLGIVVWVSEPSRLADIARLLRDTARLAGVAEAGERAAMALEVELQSLGERRHPASSSRPKSQPPRLASQPPRLEPRVFYEIWHRPLLTVNGKHLINDVIELCGGRNVFAQLPALTPAVSEEAVLAAAPDIVLGGDSASGVRAFETRWEQHPLPSLRRLPRRHVPADEIQRATPRIVAGARAVCAHLDAHLGVLRGVTH